MTDSTQAANPKWMTWAGRIVSVLVFLLMTVGGAVPKFRHVPATIDLLTTHLGFNVSTLIPLAVLELICAVLYIIPVTAVLGAVLLTGFLGGAVAAHYRVGDPYVVAAVAGVFVWVGLFLRDARVRALLPLRGKLT